MAFCQHICAMASENVRSAFYEVPAAPAASCRPADTTEISGFKQHEVRSVARTGRCTAICEYMSYGKAMDESHFLTFINEREPPPASCRSTVADAAAEGCAAEGTGADGPVGLLDVAKILMVEAQQCFYASASICCCLWHNLCRCIRCWSEGMGRAADFTHMSQLQGRGRVPDKNQDLLDFITRADLAGLCGARKLGVACE